MRDRAPLLLATLCALLSATACSTAAATSRDPAPTRSSQPATGAVSLPAAATPAAPADTGSVTIVPYREPGDHAHRNYCGAGAAKVLLSAWLPTSPDIEQVAQRAHLDPNSGVTTPDLLDAINAYLDPMAVPAIGRSWYRAERVTGLAALESRLRTDLTGSDVKRAFGHGAPVIVSTMTRTMSHWDGWQATHALSISAVDLSHGDPALDTVTYAETPSYAAGYHGSGMETTSVAALWVAMLAYLDTQPQDPLNVIW